MAKIIERKHRLSDRLYIGTIRVSFTLCIKERIPIFQNKDIVLPFIPLLKEATEKFLCKNWIYVFMPDHLHYILEGISPESNLIASTEFFKQKSGYWFSMNKIGVQWQKDYYDHIHRKEDDLRGHIFYIANNPVRKSLCQRWDEYPFLGSVHYNLHQLISS